MISRRGKTSRPVEKVSNTLNATPGNAFGDVRPTKAPVAQLLLPAQRNGRPCTSRNFLSKSAQPFLSFSPSGVPFRCRSTSPDGTAKSVTGGTRHCAGARRYRPCHNGRCQDVGVRFFGCLKADQLALPQTIPDFLFNGYFIIIMENEKFWLCKETVLMQL
jgi:hypothetical protein